MIRTYKVAKEAFRKHEIQAHLTGLMNWESFQGNFKLECWTHRKYGSVIIQFWADGDDGNSGGWMDYLPNIFNDKVTIIRDGINEIKESHIKNRGNFGSSGTWRPLEFEDGKIMATINRTEETIKKL